MPLGEHLQDASLLTCLEFVVSTFVSEQAWPDALPNLQTIHIPLLDVTLWRRHFQARCHQVAALHKVAAHHTLELADG